MSRPIVCALLASVCFLVPWPRAAAGDPLHAAAASRAPRSAVAPLSPAGSISLRAGACSSPPVPAAAAATKSSASGALYPLHDWPMARALHDSLVLVNYVDDDQGTPAIIDYSLGSHAYDGHRGTDFTLLDFRMMDRGEPVLASAAGTVAWAEHSRFDRNKGGVPPDDGNYVALDHGDGSYTWYFHLRRNSLTVEPGESVALGQMLGFAGSSGYSTAPHLHFEPGEYVAGWWTHRDPWNGPNNPLPSLWSEQEPYVGDDSFRLHSLGVFTQAAGGGNIWFVPYDLFVEGLSLPEVVGTGEPYLAVRLQYQAQAGDSYRIEVRKPNGDLYGDAEYTLPARAQFDWTYWIWYFADYVSAADHGQWEARVLVGGQTVATRAFAVGAASAFAPRFWPVAGRSIRIGGTVQRDTLRVSALGDPVTYSLSGAPPFVTLENDSIVRFDTPSTQPLRSLCFQAIAADGSARRDTMWYHVVDPAKPPGGTVGAAEVPAASPPRIESAPNPFVVSTTFRIAAPAGARTAVRVYDIRGRLVRTLLEVAAAREPREITVEWDGTDVGGRRVRSGVYLCRLDSGGESFSWKIVFLGE